MSEDTQKPNLDSGQTSVEVVDISTPDVETNSELAEDATEQLELFELDRQASVDAPPESNRKSLSEEVMQLVQETENRMQPAAEAKKPNKPVKPNKKAAEATEKTAEKAAHALKPKPKKSAEQNESPESGFQNLALSTEVQKAVTQSGYEMPTPVQDQIIPHMLEGRDVLAQSQTGTGKTAAFAMPILSRIDVNNKKPQVLVLAPTRELAIQVAKSFATYGSCIPGFNVATIYGGQDYEIQFRQLRRGSQVVVGTPGRIIDHVKRESLDLSKIECLVLDEADEMLNMGFLEDVEFVLKKTPRNRQIALFSATLPEPIRKISERYLNNPAKITIKQKTMTADSIRHRAVLVSPRDKIDLLARFLEAEETDGVLVFTRTKDATMSVAEKLNQEGLSVSALNGDMPQKIRERTIERLKAGKLDIVVATDVAARGLDITRVSHVFNFDLPEGSESYVHRVGRTGRAGRSGEAIIFLTKAQRGKLRFIEKATKQTIKIVEPPTTKDINAMRIKRFKQSITDITAEIDLTTFKKLISEYAEETGKPMDMIAAAIAFMGQRGTSFFAKDRPKRDRDERRGGKNGRERFERGDSRSGRGRDRQLGPPEPGMDRYRIEVGRKDGVKPGNIVGAVANEAGIDGSDIGPIKIHGTFSTVDLPAGMPADVFQTLKDTQVVGKQIRLRLAGDESEQSFSRNKRRSNDRSSSRSHDKNRGKRRDGAKSHARGKSFGGGKHKKLKSKA